MDKLLKIRQFAVFRNAVFSSKRYPHTNLNHLVFYTLSSESISKFYPSNIVLQARCYSKKAQGKAPKGGKSKLVSLTDEELAEVIDIHQYRNQLSSIIDKMKQNYVDHLSIHSSLGSIDRLPVSIENDTYPLNELAQISKKGQNLICINMAAFPEGLKPALQAIMESGTGFNPQQEGTMIYLTIPKVTREHRENLAKNAKSLFVKSKDEVKHLQNQFVKDAKKQTELSEDLVFNATKQLMLIAEQCVAEIETIMKTKQNELLKEERE